MISGLLRHVAILLAVVALSACRGADDDPIERFPSVTSVPGPSVSPGADEVPHGDFSGAEPGEPGCQPPSPLIGNEVMGNAPTGSLYGLLFVDPPVRAGEEVKIVWRMTGSGELLVAARQGGRPARLTFGPERHGGSNWSRPGEEWGTGFVFPAPGCWHIRLTRGDLAGDVWLDVVA